MGSRMAKKNDKGAKKIKMRKLNVKQKSAEPGKKKKQVVPEKKRNRVVGRK